MAWIRLPYRAASILLVPKLSALPLSLHERSEQLLLSDQITSCQVREDCSLPHCSALVRKSSAHHTHPIETPSRFDSFKSSFSPKNRHLFSILTPRSPMHKQCSTRPSILHHGVFRVFCKFRITNQSSAIRNNTDGKLRLFAFLLSFGIPLFDLRRRYKLSRCSWCND
jgi:hypothetical protein